MINTNNEFNSYDKSDISLIGMNAIINNDFNNQHGGAFLCKSNK